MIFWFSGTGNSRWVANEIGKATGEQLIPITSYAKHSYELKAEESVGFIFPVYWFGMPVIVSKFLEQLQLSNYRGQYTYAVLTCGIASGGAMKMMNEQMRKKGIAINGHFVVKMVDNYIIGNDIPNPEKVEKILANAKDKLTAIMAPIMNKVDVKYIEKGPYSWLSPITHYLYRQTKHEKGFWTNQQCTSCGRCEKECPAQAISLKNGKPVWSEACTFCLKCLHSCPKEAIQYKKSTQRHRRYLHP